MWSSQYDNSYSVSDLPSGLNPMDYIFVAALKDSKSLHDFDIITNYWRDGGMTVRTDERSFESEGVPDISSQVSSRLGTTRNTSDWPLAPEKYNFTVTNWFSCIVQGRATSTFEIDGAWETSEVYTGFHSSWEDGFCRLPQVPHKRVSNDHCITFCIIPSVTLEGRKHENAYRYEYFSVAPEETIRTRVCDTAHAGNLVVYSGSIEGQESKIIPYSTRKNQTFTALEHTIAISCVRY